MRRNFNVRQARQARQAHHETNLYQVLDDFETAALPASVGPRHSPSRLHHSGWSVEGKFSLGMGDRFAQEAEAQLTACIMAAEQGADVVPVWNKSNREHMIIGSEPPSVRAAAEAAIKKLGWTKEWHIDADHIRLETVDRFMAASDFFTIDVADSIGKAAKPEDVKAFRGQTPNSSGAWKSPAWKAAQTTRADVERVANKFLFAVQEAGAIYRHIEKAKGKGKFIPEVSMDETDAPQTPIDLLIILAAIADEGIPVQTIAPKFTGRFNKGVDYVGDVAQFEKEFNDDLCVIAFAIQKYGLPANLKLSVHSGSDKFSIYPAIRRAVKKHGAGCISRPPARRGSKKSSASRKRAAKGWCWRRTFTPPRSNTLTNCARRTPR
jgi:hypothetical protein